MRRTSAASGDVYDVLIVGGGPAGSSAAWALRRAGADVAVIDRRRFPRDKVCAGWITPAVVAALDLDLSGYAQGRTLQPIHGFRIGMLGRREIETRPSREPLSWGIRRCEFDDYLLRRSGADLILGRPIEQLERRDGVWHINGLWRARWLIGAGGHFCPVARRLSRAVAGETAVAAQEIEFEMRSEEAAACPVDPQVPQLFFCRDLRGYGWVFRKGDWLNVGMGREGGGELPRHVAEFRRSLIEGGRLPESTPRNFRGHAYLLYTEAARPVVADGVLLVGDAAGLAYPESGEGIRPAVESALMAAECIVGARDNGVLDAYQHALERRFGARPGARPRATKRAGRVKSALAARMLASEWFARRIVLDRWFLHRHQPAPGAALLSDPAATTS